MAVLVSFRTAHVCLLLLMTVFALPEWAAASRHLTETSPSPMEKVLRDAIKLANNETCLQADVVCEPVRVFLTDNVFLTEKLPDLGNGAVLLVDGSGCPGNCFIDGMKQFPIFTNPVGECKKLILQSLTLRNAEGSAYSGQCELEVRDSLFLGNHANTGGAIRITFRPKFKIINTKFFQNSAEDFGGAISVGEPYNPSLGGLIFNSVFQQNSVKNAGGAVSAYTYTLVVRATQFLENRAWSSAGLDYQGFNLTLVDSTFSGNVAGARGGAGRLTLPDDNSAEGMFTICSNTFTDNEAPRGPNWLASPGTSFRETFGLTLRFWPDIPEGIFATKDWGNRLTTEVSNTGCSGCSNDCQPNGMCNTSPDGEAYCSCLNQFDPGYQCNSCKVGWSGPSCNVCLPGFEGPNCTLCNSFALLETLVPELEGAFLPGYNWNGDSHLENSLWLPNATSCRAACERHNTAGPQLSPVSTPPHCNFWAFSGLAPPCGNVCMLFSYSLFCYPPGAVVSDPAASFQYETYELDPGYCP